MTQTVLAQLDRPLLATSAHVPEQDGLEIPEAAVLMDMLAGSGVAFVVDAGMQVRPVLTDPGCRRQFCRSLSTLCRLQRDQL